MNERLMEFLLRSEVEKLSQEKKKLYKFIIKHEDLLAKQAETADQFRHLLVVHSPYELAGRYLDMPVRQVMKEMEGIETELNERIEQRCSRVEWIDYTEHFSQTAGASDDKRVYLFVN
ncbi:MAG TPA: hypothetical protein VK947_05580 [Planococcus sp. (in: firmicutes)]|nr:hypothetical protein [Planococcus sp. (in: firmicutes)]